MIKNKFKEKEEEEEIDDGQIQIFDEKGKFLIKHQLNIFILKIL